MSHKHGSTRLELLAAVLPSAGMDGNETTNTLPLPVQEIVRHMRKSVPSATTDSTRKLTDVCPLTSRQEKDAPHNTKSALTPGIHSSTRTFSRSSLVSYSTPSKLTNSTNMDVIVPYGTCSVHIVANPSVSCHDQDRSAVVRFCANCQFASTSVNSASNTSGLDDIIEGSSSMTFRTPNLLNSAQQTADSVTATFSVPGKLDYDNCMPSKHSSSNTTRTRLCTEPAISSSSVLVPSDSHNQHDFPICHDVNDFSKQTAISSTMSTTAVSSQIMRHVDTVFPSQQIARKQPSLTTNQCENSPGSRIHFHQRSCRPQIGVAAVIKSTAFSREEKDAPETLQFQSPELYKLVSITSPHTPPGHLSPTRVCSGRKPVAKQISASCSQVTPTPSATTLMLSSVAAIRTNVSISHLGTVSSQTLAVEESTDEKWKDVKNFIHSPEYEPSMKRRKRIDSGSSEQMSDDNDDVSSSYGDKDEDSDDDYSDIDADLADIKPSECESLVALGKKQKQYFWQYNVQSKGPKGTRLKLAVESPRDPHVLNDFEDPVFDECNTTIAGIRHGGKARKGDGNMISPNPRKLFMIGHQLMRLSQQINACQLGTDVPMTKRNESRKEKNKLASRACRLKKKAQHEANKVKLYGLEQEHSQLNSVLQFIWPQIYKKAKSIIAKTDRLPSCSSTSTPLTSLLEAQIKQNLKSVVAGHIVEYVNSVILKVESGDYSGGLNIRRSHSTRINSLV